MEISKVCEELKDKYELELKAEFEKIAFYKRVQKALIICIAAIFVVNFLIMIIDRGNFNIFGVIMLIIFSVLGIGVVIYFVKYITDKKMEAFQKKYNEKIGRFLLEKYYSYVTIYNDDNFNYLKIYDAIGYDEKYNRDDCYVQAFMKYKEKDVRLMDISLREESNEQGVVKEKKVIFNGCFIEVDLGYKIETKIAITKEGLFGHGVGCKHKVEMDSKEFEELFNVYADDQTKAKELLNNNVMEVFKQMYAATKDGFEVVFIKDKMYLRIPEKNHLFFIGENELIDREYVNNDMQLLYLVTAIIDCIDFAVNAKNK